MEYKDMLPSVASDGIERLVARRVHEHGFLIFKTGRRVKDLISGETERCADCTCTACERRFTLAITDRQARYGGFGVWFPEKSSAAFSCDFGVCPYCGAKVRVFHVSTIGTYGSVMEERLFGEFLRLEGGSPAFVTWLVKRRIFKSGQEDVRYGRHRAYVFSRDRVRSFSAVSGLFYSHYCKDEWEELGSVRDSLGAMTVKSIVPVKDELFLGTALENAKIEKYLSEGGDECYPVTYCRAYLRSNHAENLVMSGFSGLFNAMTAFSEQRMQTGITTVPKYVDWKKARPFEMLRCTSRAQAEELKGFDGETATALLMARKAGFCPTDEELRLWKALTFVTTERILGYKQDPSRALKYLQKQSAKSKHAISAAYLLDHWDMAKAEGMLRTAEDYYPPDLRKAHDALVQLRNQRRIEEEAKKEKAREGDFSRLAKRYEKYAFTADGLTVRIASAPIELLKEGKTLHHCVGTYIKSHARGERCIFFIRREEAPDEPFYTLELDLRTLTHLQNRGLRNCEETPEVVAFRDKWLEHIREIEAAAKAPAEKKGENAA